jgi:hypothetical protein
MAFVLGLIGPETRKDLDYVREIRNAFAHAKNIISFDTPEVVTVCARLKFPTRKLYDGYQQTATARDKYQITATLLIRVFYSLGELAKDPSLAPLWLPLLRH